MSILSSSVRAALRARLEIKETQLSAAYESLDELISNNVEEYKFNSGEGSQSAKRRSLRELRELIADLEAEIENINRRLESGGICNLALRRRGGC